MPAVCGTTAVLTGQDGLVAFKPAGTQHCLLDRSDFPAGAGIVKVPLEHDFKPGDPIVFAEEGGNLDSAIVPGTTYYVGLVTDKTIQVLPTKGGTPVTLNGDGGVAGATKGPIKTLGTVTAGGGFTDGTYSNVPAVGGTGQGATLDLVVASGAVAATLRHPGTGYTVGDTLSAIAAGMGQGTTPWSISVSAINDAYDSPGGHVQVEFASYEAVCQVKSFEFSMTRDKIETTSLPCRVGGGASKYASFKTYQPGFADGTGSMQVQFTQDQASLASRLVANSMLRSQAGAWVKLYVNAVAGSDPAIALPDDIESTYIEAPVSLEGFSLGADSSGTNPTTATINFSVSGLPRHLLTVDL